MKKTIIATLLFALAHFNFTTALKVGVGIATITEAKSQFSPTFIPTDSACYYNGAWSGKLLYKVKDSIGVSNACYFQISTNSIKFDRYSSLRNDGTPTSELWVDNNGYLKRSPVAVVKRQITLTGTTNGSGIITFTFAAFPVAPNVQYTGGFGTGNKETIIPNAATTTTSCSYYVQLRADVLGLLPSYSNVSGREVNVLISEK